MFIAPAQIQDQKLKRRLRGYNRPSVEKLLQDVVSSYEQVWRERDTLRNMVDQLEKELKPLREAERHLRDSLVTAERTASELRAQAGLDAEALLEQARAKSKAQQSSAKAQQTRLKNEIERLRGVEQELQENLRTFLRSGLELVEDRTSTKDTPVAEPTQPSPVVDERPSVHKTPDATTA